MAPDTGKFENICFYCSTEEALRLFCSWERNSCAEEGGVEQESWVRGEAGFLAEGEAGHSYQVWEGQMSSGS